MRLAPDHFNILRSPGSSGVKYASRCRTNAHALLLRSSVGRRARPPPRAAGCRLSARAGGDLAEERARRGCGEVVKVCGSSVLRAVQQGRPCLDKARTTAGGRGSLDADVRPAERRGRPGACQASQMDAMAGGGSLTEAGSPESRLPPPCVLADLRCRRGLWPSWRATATPVPHGTSTTTCSCDPCLSWRATDGAMPAVTDVEELGGAAARVGGVGEECLVAQALVPAEHRSTARSAVASPPSASITARSVAIRP